MIPFVENHKFYVEKPYESVEVSFRAKGVGLDFWKVLGSSPVTNTKKDT